MKSYLPLIAIAFLITSCSTYKSGQTPDDVYYSPERPVEEYVRVEKKQERRYTSDEDYRDDRYIRMKLRDRRWSSVLDDDLYAYSYNPYNRYYNTYVSYNSPWNYYTYWNYMYNPYSGGCYPSTGYYGKTAYYTPVISTPVYNKPRTYNMYVFDADRDNNNPNIPKFNKGNTTRYSGNNDDNYRNSGSNAGNFLRGVFGNSGSSGSSSNSGSSTSSSSGSSSSSSGSSSSSSGSSNAPVRKF